MTDTPHLPADAPSSADRPADRPLVTFALFAFNQEAYIREAVEGAFAQTYQPLEIILSDDRSSDRTFQIMQEMAEAYRGPHRVRARQSGVNLGPLRHVMEVADEAAGAFMVVAAGDDISLPQRTAALTQAWQEGAGAVDSFYDIIDEAGATISTRRQQTAKGQALLNAFDPPLLLVGGLASAYETALIRKLPPPGTFILNEDTVLTVFAHLNRRAVRRVPEVLVKYRANRNALSNTGTARDAAALAARERTAQRWANAHLALLEYVDRLLAQFDPGGDMRRSTKGRLDTLLRLARYKRDFLQESSLRARLARLGKARSARELRWALSRLGGPGVYGRLAFLRNRLGL